jgi:hypothetical protein
MHHSSKTLNAFTEHTVSQLRQAVEAIGRRHSALFTHDFETEMCSSWRWT